MELWGLRWLGALRLAAEPRLTVGLRARGAALHPPRFLSFPPPSLRPLSQSRGMEGGSCPGCRAQRGWQRGGSHPWHQPQLPQAWDTPPVLRAPVRPLGVRGCSTLLSPCFTGHTLESAAPRLTLGPGLCRERTLPLLHLGPLQRGLHAGAHSALPVPIPRLRCGSGVLGLLLGSSLPSALAGRSEHLWPPGHVP